MSLKTQLVVFLILVSSIFGYSQKSFNEALVELKANHKKKSHSTAFAAAVDSLKQVYKDSLQNCPYNYLLAKLKGGFYFNVLQNDSLAIETQNEVLKYQLDCLDTNDVQLATTYFNIGVANYYYKNFLLAEKNYLKTIRIHNQLSTPHRTTSGHYSFIGEFYEIKEDYAKALFYNTKAEATHLGGENKTYRDLLRSRGILMEMIKDSSKAIALFEKSLKITERLNEVDPKIEIFLNDDLSRAYRSIGNYDLAEKHSLHAINLAENSTTFSPSGLNNLRTNYSVILKEQGRYEGSRDLLLEVREHYRKKKDFIRLSGTFENVGDVYFSQGKYIEALKNYQEGLQYLDFNLTNDIHDNPNISNRQFVEESYLSRQLGLKTIALLALANKEEDDNYYKSCLSTYLKFDSLNTRLFQEDWEEKSYATKLKETESIHHSGFIAALELYDSTNEPGYLRMAYGQIAKLKAQLLYRGIELDKNKEEQLSEAYLEKEKFLKDTLRKAQTVYEKLLGASDQQRKKAFDDFSKLRIELNLLQSESGNLLENQDFNKRVEVEDVQQLLNTDEVLLEHYLYGDSLYTFVIEKNDLRLDRSHLTSEKILETFAQLNEGKTVNSILSPSLIEILKGMDQNVLIIIPDKELLQLPFEAMKLDKDIRLIDKFEISYQYASGFIFDGEQNVPNRKLACFGSDYETSRFKVYHDPANNNSSLSPLNRTIPEVSSIARIMSGSSFINEEANKNAFLTALKTHGLFHFALHGKLNKDFPDLSSLVFESDGDDFELTASEIYDLKIPSHLTVLSACNTGAGPIEIGDGVRSLTRSFIHAGSESVLTSLWESADASTQKIMEKFYTYLSEGKRKSEALRLAKLDYLESASPTFTHPKYWAHLVLVGDNHALKSGFSFSNFHLLFFLFLFLVLAYWLWKKTR